MSTKGGSSTVPQIFWYLSVREDVAIGGGLCLVDMSQAFSRRDSQPNEDSFATLPRITGLLWFIVKSSRLGFAL